MSRLRFELADQTADAELRQLLGATPMQGKISMTFRREPSFFAAAQVDGGLHQTIIARDQEVGEIVALATRSVRHRFVNGAPLPIGYLGALRVLPEYRRGVLLARGYRFLNQLHQDNRCQMYLTTIADDNTAALTALTTGRAGLPGYNFAGKYHTLVVPLTVNVRTRVLRPSHCHSIKIRRAVRDDLADIVKFIREQGPRRQFFPCYDGSDLFGCRATLRGLEPRNLILAHQERELVGMLGCWEQKSFRQIVIESYDPSINWARPFYNRWAGWRGGVKLPEPGVPLRAAVAALTLIKSDVANVFGALLNEAVYRHDGRGPEYLLLGLHERDPLLAVAQEFSAAHYLSRLYYVCWPDGETMRLQIDQRPPYLELGCL